MEKRSIITIAGVPGSGKSTAAKGVAAQLGYPHFSSGDLFRLLAKERGIDVLQANISAEQNAEIDHLVDSRLRELGEQDNELVIDSRMAWHWMPGSFKVFLNLDMREAARRILHSLDEARLVHENIPSDPTEYAAILQDRQASEARRYRALYDVNPYDLTNYDLVIDTAAAGPEAVQEEIVKSYTVWHS